MSYTAADVKKLRDETDAPMMECKSALEEAGGDFDKAKQVLREKGKASAGKKAGRLPMQVQWDLKRAKTEPNLA